MQVEPFASLPMYDWPELQAAWDELWLQARLLLQQEGIETSTALRRSEDHERDWINPALLLGQCCGWPYVSRLDNFVLPVARFDFGLPGTYPGQYYSMFIVPAAAPDRTLAETLAKDGVRIAVNTLDSQSGWRVFAERLDSSPITGMKLVHTGSHRQSIRTVAAGKADIAAIDAVSWRMAVRHESAASAVRVVAKSRALPGLPLIVARPLAGFRHILLGALAAAVDRMDKSLRGRLGLNGIVAAEPDDYHVLTEPPYRNFAALAESAN